MPTTSSPFPQRALQRPSFAQRLLRRKLPRNALIDLVNLLGSVDSPRAVTQTDLDRITRVHRVNPVNYFRGELEVVYRDYLVHCLEDRRISDDELADIAHLRALFGLDATTCDAIQRNVARQVYLRTVSEVLADGTIDEAERDFLRKLQEHLSIPRNIAENFVDIRQRQYQSRQPRKP